MVITNGRNRLERGTVTWSLCVPRPLRKRKGDVCQTYACRAELFNAHSLIKRRSGVQVSSTSASMLAPDSEPLLQPAADIGRRVSCSVLRVLSWAARTCSKPDTGIRGGFLERKRRALVRARAPSYSNQQLILVVCRVLCYVCFLGLLVHAASRKRGSEEAS